MFGQSSSLPIYFSGEELSTLYDLHIFSWANILFEGEVLFDGLKKIKVNKSWKGKLIWLHTRKDTISSHVIEEILTLYPARRKDGLKQLF